MELLGMFVGQIQNYKNDTTAFTSAMQGREVCKLEITKTEIVGNAIADRKNHGGSGSMCICI